MICSSLSRPLPHRRPLPAGGLYPKLEALSGLRSPLLLGGVQTGMGSTERISILDKATPDRRREL